MRNSRRTAAFQYGECVLTHSGHSIISKAVAQQLCKSRNRGLSHVTFRAGLTVHFAKRYQDVAEVVFGRE